MRVCDYDVLVLVLLTAFCLLYALEHLTSTTCRPTSTRGVDSRLPGVDRCLPRLDRRLPGTDRRPPRVDSAHALGGEEIPLASQLSRVGHLAWACAVPMCVRGPMRMGMCVRARA